MVSLALLLLAFLCGSLLFSACLGRILLGLDARRFGDGDPGAANAFRAGNKLTSLLVLFLEIRKTAAPIRWAYFNLDIRGISMLLITVTPILGHVFFLFLAFRTDIGILL